MNETFHSGVEGGHLIRDIRLWGPQAEVGGGRESRSDMAEQRASFRLWLVFIGSLAVFFL